MGQYFLPVNLDKLEFIDPEWIGSGYKLRAQASTPFGVPMALMVLLATSSGVGSGDFNVGDPDTIQGRWAGDRIAVVGDYAQDQDLPGAPIPASEIYRSCRDGRDFTDIRPLVAAWFEQAFEGRFVGSPGQGRFFICPDQEVRRENNGEMEVGRVAALTPHKVVIDWPSGRTTSSLGKIDFDP